MTEDLPPLLEVIDLKKYFKTNSEGSILNRLLRASNASVVKAVDGVSFEVVEDETVGIVGESGCGKSTLGKSILRLIEPTSGEIRFGGESITSLSPKAMRQKRQEMQMIFQDPSSALNPRMKVKHLIREPIKNFQDLTIPELEERTDEILEQVDLPPSVKERYPHELSGGQKQRVIIGRAIALNPDLIVADEPVTGLDVSVQSTILNMLNGIQSKFGLSLLFIAHDLAVVRKISDRVIVLYLGQIVEIGDNDAIFENPQHPYTRELKRAIPRSHPDDEPSETKISQGEPPSPIDPPSGCPFHPRCPVYIGDICETDYPDPVELEDGRRVACHHFEPGGSLIDSDEEFDENLPEDRSFTPPPSSHHSTATTDPMTGESIGDSNG